MAANYILQDRTLADKWAITIDDGVLQIDTSVASAQSEPIVDDDISPGTHYKIFIDNSELGIEDTVTVQDDLIILDDLTLLESFKLVVEDGEFGYTTVNSYPVNRLKKNLISGFHVFLNQYLNAKIGGYSPLKLPDGTTF